MDDAKIVYAQSDDDLDRTLATIRELGADRIRVSVYWSLVAPEPQIRERPAFGAGGPADPAAYPAERWDRYDRIVRLAQRHGLGILLSITTPAPLWATGDPSPPEDAEVFQPNPDDLRDFATAVGTRYSGAYPDEPGPQPQPGPQPEPEPEPGPLPLPPVAAAEDGGGALPRVTAWSVLNEPNQPGWLGPQWQVDPRRGGRPLLPASPRIYRSLADAVYAGLAASGHGSDLLLLGETAPRGQRRALDRPMAPLEFVRELYCVDARFRPYSGQAAALRGCPADAGGRRSFAAAHPALFRASGFAHHPYTLRSPPGRSDRVRQNVALADLRRLTRTLDRALRRHGSARRLPIWLTEYGYQTTPPDPTIGISWARQAAYLAQAEYLAYRNPRVASFTQFLLVDDGPRDRYPPSDPRHWGSFQSGLVSLDGRPKVAYSTWPLPIHAERRGNGVLVFGGLRPAAAGVRLRARLERLRGGRWRTIRTLETRNRRGYVTARVRLGAAARLRLVWSDPSGGPERATREVRVR
jgi:hypothetical protein